MIFTTLLDIVRRSTGTTKSVNYGCNCTTTTTIRTTSTSTTTQQQPALQQKQPLQHPQQKQPSKSTYKNSNLFLLVALLCIYIHIHSRMWYVTDFKIDKYIYANTNIKVIFLENTFELELVLQSGPFELSASWPQYIYITYSGSIS